MYRHDDRQIAAWNEAYGFAPLSSVAFITFMDRERERGLHAKAWLIRKMAGCG